MTQESGPYGQFSPFRDAANLDELTAQDLATRLEQRARSADEISTREAYLTLLGLEPGQRVLEIGCGTGAVLRDIARLVRPEGRAVGVDPNPLFLTTARELAAAAELDHVVEFHEGDARQLKFADSTFDVSLAVTTLGHIPDGERALAEMVRVVRPGGRVGVLDREDDTYIVSHPDRALTRRVIAAGSDLGLIDSWMGRKLPRLLIRHGLRDIQVKAFTSIEQDPKGFFSNSIQGRARMAARAGAITEQELERWLVGLGEEASSGGFVVGLTHLFVWGTRPE